MKRDLSLKALESNSFEGREALLSEVLAAIHESNDRGNEVQDQFVRMHMESIVDSINESADAAFDQSKHEFDEWSTYLINAEHCQDFDGIQKSGLFTDPIFSKKQTYDSLKGFIQGQVTRRSREVMLKRARGAAESGFRKEMHTNHQMVALVKSRMEGRTQISKDFAPFLSLSDHLWVSSRLDRGSGASVEVLSWNIQELVKDGLSTYFTSFACIKKGSFNELMKLISANVVKAQEERVARLILAHLKGRTECDGSADTAAASPTKTLKLVCLQEVTHHMKAALLQMSGRYGLHAHFSATSAAESDLKCCATTCIIVREKDIETECIEWTEDVVASFENDGKARRERRFASCKVMGSAEATPLCVCSMHVLHAHQKKAKSAGKDSKCGGMEGTEGTEGKKGKGSERFEQAHNATHIREALAVLAKSGGGEWAPSADSVDSVLDPYIA
jgi:hypothetical protein